ncbi:MAG TPA: MBL fold metallo-hydrolase [Sphingobacteriaceae bacterium]
MEIKPSPKTGPQPLSLVEDLGLNEAKNICSTCGTRIATQVPLPELCPICNDDRQYIGPFGQQWTSYPELFASRQIEIKTLFDGLHSFQVVPQFAIGQRAFFLESPAGNILWDCIPFLDAPTVNFIQERGGLKAIAISHPHYYSLMAEWAEVFDCPIYIHRADQQWVFSDRERIHFWDGEKHILWDGMALINTAGHFEGSSVLHVPHAAHGILLTGDSIYVCPNRRQLTFMYSYPNHIPLPKKAINRIASSLNELSFEKVYSAFPWGNIEADGRAMVDASINHYLAILEDRVPAR